MYEDKELQEYRDLLETPEHFEEGFDWKTVVGAIFIGFLMMFTGQRERVKHYGSMLMGLGLIFYGMSLMGGAMNPLRSYEPFLQLMTQMDNAIYAVLLSAAFTALVQSSSATTGIVIVMATQGLISLEAGIALALGASVSWLGGVANISTSFDFNREEIKSRYIVKYTQGYYTVDVDQPAEPTDFLTEEVSLHDVRRQVTRQNPPLYVSSITYGRMLIFTFESEYSALELGAALDFVYRGGVDVSGALERNDAQ